ncbi:PaaI family thioesterase, partial [Listeria monocytogenes]
EINANHLASKQAGLVTATAEAIHIGKSTQVWEIKITDETEKLLCISRCTIAVKKKRK